MWFLWVNSILPSNNLASRYHIFKTQEDKLDICYHLYIHYLFFIFLPFLWGVWLSWFWLLSKNHNSMEISILFFNMCTGKVFNICREQIVLKSFKLKNSAFETFIKVYFLILKKMVHILKVVCTSDLAFLYYQILFHVFHS